MRKESRTEMMIPVSIVSRKTMKKIGTANTLGMVMAKALDRVSEGRFGLERLQSFIAAARAALVRFEKYPELDRSGISDSDLIRWADIDLIKLRTSANVGHVAANDLTWALQSRNACTGGKHAFATQD